MGRCPFKPYQEFTIICIHYLFPLSTKNHPLCKLQAGYCIHHMINFLDNQDNQDEK
jgi:hypothetical protein